MSEMEKKMNEHWNFLEEFIDELSPLINWVDLDDEGFEKALDKMDNIMIWIKYGYKLAWPHAWKHGVQEYLSRYEKKEQEDDEV